MGGSRGPPERQGLRPSGPPDTGHRDGQLLLHRRPRYLGFFRVSLAAATSAALVRLSGLLAERARIEAWLLLAEASIEGLARRADRMAELLSRAADIASIAEQRLQAVPAPVTWSALPDDVVMSGAIDAVAAEKRGER